MPVAKLSISVDRNWIQFIDNYRKTHHVRSKSEVIEQALKLLKHAELREQYKDAYQEWFNSSEESVWDAVSGDGISDETW